MYVLQLFLDDNVKNVAAGKEMGLHTVLVIVQTKVKFY
jgi:methionine salvage enolase-phosphatase E1